MKAHAFASRLLQGPNLELVISECSDQHPLDFPDEVWMLRENADHYIGVNSNGGDDPASMWTWTKEWYTTREYNNWDFSNPDAVNDPRLDRFKQPRYTPEELAKIVKVLHVGGN